MSGRGGRPDQEPEPDRHQTILSRRRCPLPAEVLSCRVSAERAADDADELVAGEVRCWQAVLGVVDVHGLREAIGEHLPVGTVNRHRVLDDALTDVRAVFEPANSGFEISGHGSPSRKLEPVLRAYGLRWPAQLPGDRARLLAIGCLVSPTLSPVEPDSGGLDGRNDTRWTAIQLRTTRATSSGLLLFPQLNEASSVDQRPVAPSTSGSTSWSFRRARP